jgi:hypothetical protein
MKKSEESRILNYKVKKRDRIIYLMIQPLSFVAGTGEPLARRSQKSNFDLLKDISEVVDYCVHNQTSKL